MASHNGNGLMRPAAFLDREGPLTAKYRPSSHFGAYHWALQRGAFSWNDIDAMRRDQQVGLGLRVIRAPLFTATWEIQADSPDVEEYIDNTLSHFWRHALIKSLKMVEWGSAGGEVVWKEDDDGRIIFDDLRDIHLWDLAPLELKGQLAGVACKSLPNRNAKDGGHLKILPPRSFWVANEPEFGRQYGRSRLEGAWEPWMEKRGKHGAVDIRRLWFIKNVFTGGIMRHPMGTIEVAPGVFKPNEEYAREIMEKRETGGVMTLPNAFDPESKQYLWSHEEAKINGDAEFLLEYPKHLDVEILMGMGIMPEVVQAAETGSGWSGRSVPMMVFLYSEDQIVDSTITAVDRQIVRHGVDVNFGPETKYKIKPVSLVPKEQPQQFPGGVGQDGEPGAEGEAAPGQPGQPGAGGPPQAMGGNPATDQKTVGDVIGMGANPVKMSAAAWDESKRHRGQPENAGEFGPGGNGGKSEAPVPASAAAPAPSANQPPPPDSTDRDPSDAKPNPQASAPVSVEDIEHQADIIATETAKKTFGLLGKVGAAGVWMKDKTKQTYQALEQRYGRKQAIAIFAAGHVVGLATPLVVVPGSTMLGMVPFAALAEVYLQAKRAMSAARMSADADGGAAGDDGREKSLQATTIEETLTPEQIQAAGQQLVDSLGKEWAEYAQANAVADPGDGAGEGAGKVEETTAAEQKPAAAAQAPAVQPPADRVQMSAEHDVSGEKRDSDGKWTAGGGSGKAESKANPKAVADMNGSEALMAGVSYAEWTEALSNAAYDDNGKVVDEAKKKELEKSLLGQYLKNREIAGRAIMTDKGPGKVVGFSRDLSHAIVEHEDGTKSEHWADGVDSLSGHVKHELEKGKYGKLKPEVVKYFAGIVAQEAVANGKNISDVLREKGINPVKAMSIRGAISESMDNLRAAKNTPSPERQRAMDKASKTTAEESPKEIRDDFIDSFKQAKQTDKTFKGEGRYEAELWMKLREKHPKEPLPKLTPPAAEYVADEYDRDGKQAPQDVLDAIAAGKGDVRMSATRRPAGPSRVVRLAQVHAPHTMTIAGTEYRGGQFIPGSELAKVTPEEKKAILDSEHMRADDDGAILTHHEAGGNPAAVTIRGDKGFETKIAKYMAGHVAREADTFRDAMTDIEDEGAEDGVKKSAAARDAFDENVTDFAGQFIDSTLAHFKQRWGEYADKADAAAFTKAVEDARDAITGEAYAIHADLKAGEPLDFDAFDEHAEAFGAALRDAADAFNDQAQSAIDDEEAADQAQRDEIEESQFDDIHQEAADVAGEDADEDALAAAYKATIQSYNKMLAGGDNPYRVSMNDDGELEAVLEDDLPDEFRPPKEKKGRSARMSAVAAPDVPVVVEVPPPVQADPPPSAPSPDILQMLLDRLDSLAAQVRALETGQANRVALPPLEETTTVEPAIVVAAPVPAPAPVPTPAMPPAPDPHTERLLSILETMANRPAPPPPAITVNLPSTGGGKVRKVVNRNSEGLITSVDEEVEPGE